MRIFGIAYIIAAVIAACGGNQRQQVKAEPVYQAPAWEYVEWAGVEGQDGGEIDVSNW